MRRIAATALAAVDAVAVARLWPDVPGAAATLARPRAALAADGADGALVPVLGALTWFAAVWLAVGLGAAGAARLPGLAGRVGRTLAGRLLPRAVLSLVSGSAGLGLLLAPVAAAAPAGHRPPPAWPVTSTSAPAWPTTGTATTPVTPGAPGASATPTNTGRPAATHEPAGGRRDAVTVHRGDSLWTIARARLGPTATPTRVAREWPRWFAANRSVIGADPDLLRPGQVLRAPAAAHPSDPSSDPSSTEARP